MKSFAKLLWHFIFATVTGTSGIIKGGMQLLGGSIFSPGMSYYNLSCVENMFERQMCTSFVLQRGLFQADQHSVNCNMTSFREQFSESLTQTRYFEFGNLVF